QMRRVPGLRTGRAAPLLTCLATRPGGRGAFGGRGRGGGPTFPAGPVVASGGVKTPAQPGFDAQPAVTLFPGNGGNGGNAAYPADADSPSVRYVSEWGVQANATKP